MADIKHDHYMLGVIDLILHSPVAAEAGAVGPGQLRTERPAHPPWIIEEGGR